MAVYTRIPCPKCTQGLNLRLEYLNRKVVCNYCKHQFLSRAKVKIPAAASPELIRVITAVNRAQGFRSFESGSSETIAGAQPVELTGSSEFPRLEPGGSGDHAALAADEPSGSTAAPRDPAPGEAASLGDVVRQAASPAGTAEPPAELTELRSEPDRLLAQIESARSQADASAHLEAELRSARAECDQQRLTVKLLRADLAQRVPDLERLHARLAEADHARAARDDELRQHREQADAARRAAEDHRAEVGRLARELEHALQAQARSAQRASELAEHLERLSEELERQTIEREDEREAHRRSLQTQRLEWEEKLRSAQTARAAETAAAAEALHAEAEDLRQRADRLRQERDAALRLVEEFYQEQRRLTDRVAGLESETDRLDTERLAAVVDAESLRARLAELERSLASARAGQAGIAPSDAERLADERDHASIQLGVALTQLDDALAQLEQARRQLEVDRQAMQSDVESRREHAESLIRAQAEAALEEERGRSQAETERLNRELEQARREKEAESHRGGELAERLQRLEADIDQHRKDHEAEVQAHRNTIEELQLLLKSWQRHDPSGSTLAPEGPAPDPGADSVAGGPADTQCPLAAIEAGRSGDSAEPDGQPPQADGAPDGSSAAPDGQAADGSTPLDVAFGPNALDSPDERIAALRVYLRKIHEAEEERMNNRLLRRLTRVWRHSDA